MIVLWIYLIGFVLNPIFVIGIDKKLSGCMDIPKSFNDRLGIFFVISVVWPLALIFEFYLILDYWYEH